MKIRTAISPSLTVRAAVLAVLQTAAASLQAADTQQMPKISVDAAADPYKVDLPSSPKYTELLRDTPQTITIVGQQLIEDQKLLTLRDILSTVPGITFGAGEGGGGYGDSITLRGFTGSGDVTIDGVRDSTQYSRTDPFNLAQVEVVNGASSVYSGAGAVGGTINLVSKQAHDGNSTLVNGSAGTDRYARLTADTNRQLSERTAVRVNAMLHRNDVAGRDYERFERWGIAPSLTLGLNSDTTFALNYLHQSDDNLPQYGVPFFNGRPLPGVDRSNYYGYRNIDEQQIDTDSLTGILTHRFSDNLSLRNLARVQQVEQFSLVDASQGTWCLAGNATPTGSECISNTGITVPEGQYLPSGPRGYGRDTTNRILYNQTDFTLSFDTGAIGHALVTGLSFSHETFTLDTTNDFRNADGTNPFAGSNHLPFMDISRPDATYTGPRNRTLVGKTDGELDNAAVYAFDTLKFSEQWQFNAGIRFERNDGSSVIYTVQSTASDGGLPAAGSPPIGTITGANVPAKNTEDLFSYRAGLIFKPQEAGTVYFSYGNSKNPSKATVNGSCNVTPTTRTGANCNVGPESAVSYELGTKWDLLDERLAVTAALFRNDHQNYRVNDPDPLNLSSEQALDGRARVDGLLLGVGGNIAPNWALSANYAYLDSEVLQGASDYSVSRGEDYTRGDPVLQVPEHSFSLWSTYQLPFGLQLGYGATYQGKIFLTQHSSDNPDGPLVTAPSFITHRAMASYTFSSALDVQFNINNLFDKEYYTRIRNNGWATPGEGRTVIASASYRF